MNDDHLKTLTQVRAFLDSLQLSNLVQSHRAPMCVNVRQCASMCAIRCHYLQLQRKNPGVLVGWSVMN